jgi:F420-dependent oxidoreductase-like protein
MKIGLQINRFDYPQGVNIRDRLTEIAEGADEAGFDSGWVMDHFFQITNLGPATDPMLEAYTTLGYLAGVTKHMKLGTLVTGAIYREPALLIKAVTTLDVVSGGRAYFGVGAGWNEEEAIGLGLTSPLTSKRFERLEETLQIAKRMWSDDDSPFDGKFYKLERPMNHPQSVSKPHPPILVGGAGEQKTLLLVAKYADACNLFNTPDLEHKLEVLRQHCHDVGRNYDEIEKTAAFGIEIGPAVKDVAGTIEKAKHLCDLGITHLIFRVGNSDASTYREAAKELIPKMHEL